MTKLKPCPFCGSENAKMESNTSLFGDNIEIHRFYVRCGKCYACSGVEFGIAASHQSRLSRVGVDLPKGETTDNKLKILAAEAWNRRADDE